MMTDSRFPSKVRGSLTRRIFVLCLGLLVLPLLIYSFVIIFEISKGMLWGHLAILFLLFFGLGGAIAWGFSRRMARPLEQLSTVMTRVEEGHVSSRYTPDPLGFEINVLGEHFNRTVEGLLAHMEAGRKEKMAKELLMNELKIGHEIQKSVFPKEIPHLRNVDIATGFVPALEVSGDFYDLFAQDDGSSLLLAIGDVSGKGVSACLYAFLLRSMLRATFHCDKQSLAQVVTQTNHLFCLDTQESGYFGTAWIASLNEKGNVLHFINLGHPPALLLRHDGTIEELTTRGIALGVDPALSVKEQQISLHRGDLLLLYTDGIIEAHDPQGRLFGKERLLHILAKAKTLSANEAVHLLLDEVKTFSAGALPHDDITLIALRLQ